MACLTPFSVKQKHSTDTIPVPCGKCPECRARRASSWSYRLMEEEKRSVSSYFITLTYDTKHITPTQNGFMDLSKRDLQLFFKRLRKAHEKDSRDNSSGSCSEGTQPIKYYACGEYGGKTFRPHYHIILFNAKLQLIQPAWDKGHVHYGSVSGASIGYTLKYITKKSRIPLHRNDDRQREFSLMSKGLGNNYVGEWIKDCKEVLCKDGKVRKVYFDVHIGESKVNEWHKKDLKNRMYCNLPDGKKIAMPRYYKDKIYCDPSLRKAVGYHARQKMVKQEYEDMKKAGEDYFRNKREAEKVQWKKMEKNEKYKV